MNTEYFANLHQQAEPLVICNVWDAASAKVAEKLNFKAIGTSSAALANVLGYNDGEELAFEELLFLVNRIAKSSQLPLSVDIEAGYSKDPVEVAQNIKQLANLGVVGINIEDSKVKEDRAIADAEDFAAFLQQVKLNLAKENVEVFINVRTDTFLLGLAEAVAETKKRISLYQQAGADGIFVPCITEAEDIKTIVASTSLPVNVMCMPELPNFELLQEYGVKRISMGNFVFDKAQANIEQTLAEITNANSFAAIF